MRHLSLKQTMGSLCVALSLLIYPASPARADVDFSIGIHLGINVPVYPRFVRIPGYPVYYAPRLSLNYFFYDGLYWVYQDDHWYASSWYNGPWGWVAPEYVPVFVLRIPVRYYRHPPVYFYGWRPDAPPRWSERWGRDWEDRRYGWDRWDRRSAPRPAPLPSYQQRYSGKRYPDAIEQQQRLRSENYRYQPREENTRQQWQPQRNPERPRSEPQPRIDDRPDRQGPPPAQTVPPRPLPDRQYREREREVIPVPRGDAQEPVQRPQPQQTPRPADRQERYQRDNGRDGAPPERIREFPSRPQSGALPQPGRPEHAVPGAQPMPPQFRPPTERPERERRSNRNEDREQERR